MDLKQIATWASVVVQGAAAFLWVASTKVKVSYKQVEAEYQKTHPNLSPGGIVDEDGNEVNATSAKQAVWSGYAAWVTGAGVALQAIATALPGTP